MAPKEEPEISYRGVTVRDSEYPESYDEYLETIYRLSLNNPMGWVKNKDISVRLNVKAPSVTNMLEKLRNAHLISWTPRKGIRLTDEGRTRAKQIVSYHVLMELFLNRVLGMDDWKKVNKLACDFEHHITPDLQARLIHLMGLEEEFKNSDNFIYEDRFPEHIKTQPIYTTSQINESLEILKKEFLNQLHGASSVDVIEKSLDKAIQKVFGKTNK